MFEHGASNFLPSYKRRRDKKYERRDLFFTCDNRVINVYNVMKAINLYARSAFTFIAKSSKRKRIDLKLSIFSVNTLCGLDKNAAVITAA
ncbi:hypothetical protein [Salinivibrio costicola]|uniref:hypothetical protein n=1 Tax=Salinivibrio costicola TaxID=51367 RepID=UPI002540189E|nr:hypothetical protein [Salinivibrio costicola]